MRRITTISEIHTRQFMVCDARAGKLDTIRSRQTYRMDLQCAVFVTVITPTYGFEHGLHLSGRLLVYEVW